MAYPLSLGSVSKVAFVPTLDLHLVDELIVARQALHGGGVGAPPMVNGHRVGSAINRSCVVMLSAIIQAFVEDVFIVCSQAVFPHLNGPTLEKYRKSIVQWGNPNPDNIERLFLRIGADKVLTGLSWQKCTEGSLRTKLDHLNQLRNGIAHGRTQLQINGNDVSVSLASINNYRGFAQVFGQYFESHARLKTMPTARP